MNPIIAMLHNTTKDTYHPIVFLESPLPGPYDPAKPIRHKSKMHHTGGFATHTEALDNAKSDLAARIKEAFGTPRFSLAKSFPWDGVGIPAITTFFAETPEGLIPVL